MNLLQQAGGAGDGSSGQTITAPSISITKQDIPALTSIRGVAAWWVVMFHLQLFYPKWLPQSVTFTLLHGYLGVDLFFVLSGYVIALNYARKLTHPSLVAWLRFLWLRIARIYPLHAVMLALFCINFVMYAFLAGNGVPADRFGAGYFALSVLLMQNWGFTLGAGWNAPAWSISVEWLLYLLFPALLWLFKRLLVRRAACWGMIFTCLALLAAVAAQFEPTSYAKVWSLGPIRGLFEFWAGVSLYHARMLSPHGEPWISLTVATLLCAVSLALPIHWYVLLPTAILLVVHSMSFTSGTIARFMGNRLLLYLGKVSYSTYMVHQFVIDLVRALLPNSMPHPAWAIPICLALTAIASYPLYRFVEMRGRRALRRVDLGRLWKDIALPEHQA